MKPMSISFYPQLLILHVFNGVSGSHYDSIRPISLLGAIQVFGTGRTSLSDMIQGIYVSITRCRQFVFFLPPFELKVNIAHQKARFYVVAIATENQGNTSDEMKRIV